MLHGLMEARTLKFIEVNELNGLEEAIRNVTWHSMVTMLSEAVKARVDDKMWVSSKLERSQPTSPQVRQATERALRRHGQGDG